MWIPLLAAELSCSCELDISAYFLDIYYNGFDRGSSQCRKENQNIVTEEK